MTQKIFTILGATGHIGHVIAEDLLKRGHIVRAVGRDKRKLHQLESKGALPVVLNLDDSDALAEAFRDTWAVFTMIPPGEQEEDMQLFQERVGDAIVKAIQKANVKRVVNLSSVGAELAEGSGPIMGLRRLEQKLNALQNFDCLVHLRPNYFMENLYAFLPMIQQGVIKAPLPGDLKMPMVASRDIGWKAADFLDNSLPKLRLTFDFVGPKEISLKEVTALFGQAFDYPDLRYQQISFDEEKKMLMANGLSAKKADLMIELERAFADGRLKTTQEMSRTHIGTTTLETFIEMIAHRTLAKTA
ncbi:MAG: NAD(P)H-binding protein [Parachlamydia sp.]|nr:NAD(P)H-binding protein [Parachlamydia sp.]